MAPEADGQIRTDDRSITSRVLYQLSYTSNFRLPILAFVPCELGLAGKDAQPTSRVSYC